MRINERVCFSPHRRFNLSSCNAREAPIISGARVSQKNWDALLCGGETATQRLRGSYVVVPMRGHNGARGRTMTAVYTCARTCTLVKRMGRRGEGWKIHLATSFIFIP